MPVLDDRIKKFELRAHPEGIDVVEKLSENLFRQEKVVLEHDGIEYTIKRASLSEKSQSLPRPGRPRQYHPL
jgi:hypothetical protein